MNYPFLTQKERDIETGLDYFLARYYSSTQGRFTSPDEFSGGPDELFDFTESASENPTFYANVTNPQSLNKYQYTYNDPLNLVDPDGHCPAGCPFDPQGPRRTVDALIAIGSKGLDVLQTGLSAVGLIPGAGEAADALNAGVSTARGNYVEAAMDLGGTFGPAGSAAALGNRVRKIAGRGADVVDAAADASKTVHKNSLEYVGDSHVYKIKAPDGTVAKIGESSQGTRKRDGASKRAESQVRKLNREVGPGHRSKIVRRTSGKRESRNHETKLIKRVRRRYGNDALPENKGDH